MTIEQMALAILRARSIRDMALKLFWLYPLGPMLDGWGDRTKYAQKLAASTLDGAISYKEARRLMEVYCEAETRGLEQRDKKLEGPAEDKREAKEQKKEDGSL